MAKKDIGMIELIKFKSGQHLFFRACLS